MDSAIFGYRRGHNSAGRVLWPPEDLGPWVTGLQGQSSPKSMTLALLSSTLDTPFGVIFRDGWAPARVGVFPIPFVRGGPLPRGRRSSDVTRIG